MGGKLSGFKVVDLVRSCNSVETEVGVTIRLSRDREMVSIAVEYEIIYAL